MSAASLALAEDAQVKSDQIVKHFVESVDLGAKRGICVGTTEECNASAPAPTGMDMLINFDLNSASLTEQARANLDEFAKALKDDRLRAASFVVEGYTDASGNEIYNDNLSERRAAVGDGVPAAERCQRGAHQGDRHGREEPAGSRPLSIRSTAASRCASRFSDRLRTQPATAVRQQPQASGTRTPFL